jgi:hypothetical protein
MLSRFTLLILLVVVILAGCEGNEIAQQPTATLAPIVSLTPRFTATPIPSRTPTPTLTLTPTISPVPPTASNTPSPTVPPPVMGVISSLQSVNIRSGPAVDFSAIVALQPNSEVEVLGVSPDGSWFNILMGDGREGWVSATLVFVQASPTPFPSSTPPPNLTLLAQSTLPTALFGGGTITPSPPPAAISPTPGTVVASAPTALPGGAGAGVPTIDVNAINLTATALVGGAGAIPATQRPAGGPTGGPLPLATTPPAPSGPAVVGQAVDVFALCDNPSFRIAAPSNIAAGTTIDIYFAWFAQTRQQVEQHVAAAVYDIRLDGNRLQVPPPDFIRPSAGGGYEAFWYIHAGTVSPGQRRVTYRVTWNTAIFDGAANFGPGTSITEESGSCTFTVR